MDVPRGRCQDRIGHGRDLLGAKAVKDKGEAAGTGRLSCRPGTHERRGGWKEAWEEELPTTAQLQERSLRPMEGS